MQRLFIALLPLMLVCASLMLLLQCHIEAQVELQPAPVETLGLERPKDYCPQGLGWGTNMQLCRQGKNAVEVTDPGGTWDRSQ